MDWQLVLFITLLLFGYYLGHVLEKMSNKKKIQNNKPNYRVLLINANGSNEQLNRESINDCLTNLRVTVHTITRKNTDNETSKWSIILN